MNKLNWKNIIKLIIGLVILAFMIYAVVFYQQIEKSKANHFDDVAEFVLNETDLTKINQLYHFQEEKSYYILEGQDDQGVKWMVFHPEKNKDPDKLKMYEMKKLVGKEQIESEWSSECQSCTLKKSSPAMMDETPLWELTYMDEHNRYVMEYVFLKDGSTYEKIRLHRKYKKKG